MEQLGFSLQTQYALPMPQVLALLRHAGFRGVSPLWQDDPADFDRLAEEAARCDLALHSLHGRHQGIIGMWSRDPDRWGPIFQSLMDSVDACHTYGIGILVVHPWCGFSYDAPRPLCFDRFDALVEHAKAKGVQIALENLEGPEFLQALMHRYTAQPHVGFCYDSGHNLCYAPEEDFLSQYGQRLIMTHLNDNLGITHPQGILQGIDDLHLLPFDGIGKWEQIMHRLKLAKPQRILNFELKIRPKPGRCKVDLYGHLPLPDFIDLAYRRAAQAAALYFD